MLIVKHSVNHQIQVGLLSLLFSIKQQSEYQELKAALAEKASRLGPDSFHLSTL